jgi:hypothetical protein
MLDKDSGNHDLSVFKATSCSHEGLDTLYFLLCFST